MTATALDLSEYVTSTDSPELAEYKETVKRVAQKYAKANNWCGEVNRALREMGIDPKPTTVEVAVATTIGLTLTARVEVKALAGKSLDEQKAVVAKGVGTLFVSGPAGVKASNIDLTPEGIISLALAPKPEPEVRESITTNARGAWRYASPNGRVLHFFPQVELDNGYHWKASTCHTTALERDMSENSPRGTGNLCIACQRELSR